MAALPERQVIQMLLVRAAEEQGEGLVSPEQAATAAAAAIDATDDREILEKRTAYLYLRLPKTLRGLAHAALLPEDQVKACLVLAVVAGMASNYVGPSGYIHVAYNPLTLLLGWNLAVLLAVALRRVRGRRVAASEAGDAPGLDPPVATTATLEQKGGGEASAEPPAREDGAAAEPAKPPLPRRWSWLLAGLYLRWRARWAAVDGARENARDTGRVVTAFLESYRRAASGILGARVEALLHIGAVGILAGALAGTYLRGLFFEYNAIWRSTFLTDPGAVTDFLNVLLAPAVLLLHGRFLGTGDVGPLFFPTGDPAGPWIHLLAVTLGLVVVPARVLLALLAARRANAAAAGVPIDLSDPYYGERIRAVREGMGLRIREGVATAFRLEAAKLSESVALFVRDHFFDTTVAPTLVAFRNRGGRIADLEEELRQATEKLQPELAEHLASGEREMQHALVERVREILGREVQVESTSLSGAAAPALPLDRDVTVPLAETFGDAIGASVTTAVAAAVATISGGLGKSLGVAIVSGLLHTSGPIGLLIGGVAAAAVVGGAFVLGRERVTESVKGWSLPAAVVSLALRDSKIEEAREATYARVRREVEEGLGPRIDVVTAAILREIPSLV